MKEKENDEEKEEEYEAEEGKWEEGDEEEGEDEGHPYKLSRVMSAGRLVGDV